MLIFNWDPRLELGIELIDTQHKNIISHANTFFISYKGGNPGQRLRECLSFLEQYVLYHFQAEEAFQVECGYPGYLEHRAEHASLKMQFRFQGTKLNSSGFSRESIDGFYDFMRNWVSDHILNEDMRFASYYRARSEENSNI